MRFRRLLPAAVVLAGFIVPVQQATASPAEGIGSFTFLHLSDQHFPHQLATSTEVIRQAVQLGTVRLAPFDLQSDPPAFALSTGDMTEFGTEGWEAYLGAWAGARFPIYHQTGNHDNTWTSLRPRIRELHGSNNYSFDYGGCHFIGLDTASPQDPRPSIGRELLLWLDEDLARVAPTTPVFVFLHHPPGGREFASPFECQRLYDQLATHNVVVLLVGHGHGARKLRCGPFDAVMGGSTYGKIAGYSVLTIRDGKLFSAYRLAAEPEATVELLSKDLPVEPGPVVTIEAPPEGAEAPGEGLHIEATLSETDANPTAAQVALDGMVFLDLELNERRAAGEIPAEHLTPGAHSARIGFKTEGDDILGRSTFFYVPAAEPKVLWRTFLGGSSKSRPAVDGDRLYVGADDGKLYCLDASDGRSLWSFETGGEVLAEPCLTGEGLCFGSGDGSVYTVGVDGRQVWRTEVGSAVYSSPVTANGAVFLGANSGRFYALSASTGAIRWVCEEPTYGIESKPFVDEETGVVYFGAWDEYVYAVNAGTGELLWKVKGAASATKPAPRYYSPADCGPVSAAGKVYIPDRGYQLAIIDAATGERTESIAAVAGVSLAPDGTGVYLRRNKAITKLGFDGETLWHCDLETGYLPTVAAAADGRLFALSDRGLLSCLEEATGRLLYQYRVTPRLWTMSSPTVHDGRVFVSAMDGSVTAMR